MNTIQQIAVSLAFDLRERYPLDEIIVTPSNWYDLKDKEHPQKTTYSLSAIKGKISLWGVNISGDFISVTIYEDAPELKIFNDIKGLPGVAFGTMISKDSKTTKFALAEPGSIENVLAKIEEYYPICERIENAETDNPPMEQHDDDRHTDQNPA